MLESTWGGDFLPLKRNIEKLPLKIEIWEHLGVDFGISSLIAAFFESCIYMN